VTPYADSEKVQDPVSTISTRRRPASAHPVPEEAPAGFHVPFERGQVLGGKYEVEDLIGVGGIAFVVSARHVGFDSLVALKFLRPELAQLPDARAHFTTEAQNNFRLESEHIVRVLDVDELPQGLPYMVMELLQGRDLRTALAHGPLSVPLAAEYALQVAAALAAAHASGLVHCDIKPENLFVLDGAGDEPWLKVLDFGIARAVQGLPSPDQRVVSSGAVGSPPYMSPEQVRASPDLDARTDIWSLGCVLYELLTLRVPFHRSSRMESCAAVLEQEPPPVRALRADLPAEIEDVLARCLRKVASERYANVAELAEALAPFAPERARRHAARCRQLLSAGPRISVTTDPGRRSRPSVPPFGSQRLSSPEALVATQLLAPPSLAAHGEALSPRATKRRKRPLLLGAAVLASAAGFAVMERIQDPTWPGSFAAARPATSFAKGSQVRSLTPQLPPGPSVTSPAPVEAAAATTTPATDAADALGAPVGATVGARAELWDAPVRVAPVRTARALARRPVAANPGKLEAHSSATTSHPAALRDEPDVGF
jgi:eukaryotic-like serine/threonine-protein kinase